MAYIGSKPANKPVVASDIDPTVITGQTALAVAPADTDEFLISDAGTLKRLDASLIGGANTPIVYVLSADASITNSATQKLPMSNEIIDTASAFDPSSNYRFTVPSGQDGKYYINLAVEIFETADTLNSLYSLIYKNGSEYAAGRQIDAASNHAAMRVSVDCIVSLVATDYIEFYTYVNGTDDLAARTSATIFKLIE